MAESDDGRISRPDVEGRLMSDEPWAGDACSLVEAFRRGDRTPGEELEATLGALADSALNAFTHIDSRQAS